MRFINRDGQGYSASTITASNSVSGSAVLETILHVAVRSIARTVMVVVAVLFEGGEVDVTVRKEGVTLFAAPAESDCYGLAVDRTVHGFTEPASVVASSVSVTFASLTQLPALIGLTCEHLEGRFSAATTSTCHCITPDRSFCTLSTKLDYENIGCLYRQWWKTLTLLVSVQAA